MRINSTSPIWPVTGVVLAVLFTAASSLLILNVSGMRGELEDTVGHITALTALEREVDGLSELAYIPRGMDVADGPEAEFRAAVKDLRLRAETVQASRYVEYDVEPPLILFSKRLDALEGYAQDIFHPEVDAPGEVIHAAVNRYLDTCGDLKADVRSLIAAERGRAGGISLGLGHRWSAMYLMLFTACGIAGLTAWLLWRNQHNAASRREALERLAEAEDRLGTVVANAPIAVWAVDANGSITLCVGAALADTGVYPDELVGRSVFDAYADRPEVVDAHRRVLEGEAVDYRTKNGDMVLQALLIPIRGERGLIVGATGVATDVTARERAIRAERREEVQRAESQKAEALARVAGGVAHEFSNLLTVVSGFAALLKSNPDLNSTDREDVHQILKAAGRAAELTQQLLAFSRRQRTEPRIVDLNAIVLDGRKMLETLLGSHVEVRVLHSSGPLAVHIDPGQFQQVLVNLGLNARDAMPEGGTFTMALSEVDQDEIVDGAQVGPGMYACLSISDDGLGMDEETRRRVFEPFFSTKGPQRGTGLGLPTVQGILRQAGGDVTIDSEPERGTTFRIYLPRRDSAAIDVDPDTAELRVPGGRETVLLVEDEAMVRAFTARVLRRAGYEVLEAVDGKNALETAEAIDQEIDILVSDIVMPGMNGKELAKRYVERSPGTPVLFLTGYAHENDGIDVLQKPFSPNELCRMVRACIDASERTQARNPG